MITEEGTKGSIGRMVGPGIFPLASTIRFLVLSCLSLPVSIDILMDRALEPVMFCRTCSIPRPLETRYRSDNEFIGKILVCEHCGETVFEPLRTGCADC
jgi:hypothetical protein